MEITTMLLNLVLIPVLGALASFLVAFIKAKTAEVKQKTDNDLAKTYIDILSNVVVECVTATNQTYVDELKKNGAFTKEAQEIALQKTFDSVMSVLSDEAKKHLKPAVGDLSKFVTQLIEAEVKNAKKA